MPFAILRTQKLKSVASVQRSMRHAFREQETPNAAKELASQNTHIGAQSVAEGMEAFAKALPAKHRKDAVLAIEYLITASPEAMASKNRAEQDRYFDDSLAWLRSRHGDTVVYAGIHRDEQTPHMYAYVVPRDPATGRLNARKWLGGAKALQVMQTEFANQVGKAHGLERGIEGSKATHQRVSQFYGQIERQATVPAIDAAELTPQGFKEGWRGKLGMISHYETAEGVAERLTAKVAQAVAPLAQNAAVAVQERRRAAEMTRTARTLQDAKKSLQERLDGFLKLFGGLSSDQVKELAKQAATMRAGNELEAEKKRRVDALPDLVRKRAGAVHTFALKALDAIKKASGNWRVVEWAKVEKEAFNEAVREHGQPVKESLERIILASPGQAHVSPADARRAAEMAPEIPGLDNRPIPSQSHGFSR